MSLKRFVKTPFKIKKMKLLQFGRDFKPDSEIILRDYLAIERTRLANERTLLSYIRSSLYLLLGGVAFFQLHIVPNFKYLAFVSLFFSVIFLVIGIYRFMILKKSLKKLYNLAESIKDGN
jgi:putative membrane protein